MPSTTSCAAVASLPVGQITETSYPAETSVVASFQTRRSKGTGRFSTIISTCFDLPSMPVRNDHTCQSNQEPNDRIDFNRCRQLLPVDADVALAEPAIIGNAHQIDEDLIAPHPLGDRQELGIPVSDYNDFGVIERLR